MKLNPEWENAPFELHLVWDNEPKWSEQLEPKRFRTFEDGMKYQSTLDPKLCIQKWITE